ncbi:hypothetical protein C8Q76DRAFT_739534 [Earliella scabrosa]|nr:hypothetical protein C8Q76DRAFT_739534 [Earliella scabrosa]
MCRSIFKTIVRWGSVLCLLWLNLSHASVTGISTKLCVRLSEPENLNAMHIPKLPDHSDQICTSPDRSQLPIEGMVHRPY